MPKVNCKDCEFFEVSKGIPNKAGECIKGPPSVTGVLTQSPLGQIQPAVLTYFPHITNAEKEGCFEGKTKISIK